MKTWNLRTKILFAFIITMLIFSSIHLLLLYRSNKGTVTATLQTHGERIAQEISKQIDPVLYQRILDNPVESEDYWKLRYQLNEIRESIGAMYVDTIRIDEKGEALYVVDGQPKDSKVASPINEPADVFPVGKLKEVLNGNSFKSDLIDDPKYGLYFAIMVPIQNKEKEIIGILEVDLSAADVKTVFDTVWAEEFSFSLLIDLVMLIIFVVATAYIIRMTLRPMDQIRESAAQIAQGDLRLRAMRADASQRDEVGLIINSFHSMAERLRDLIRSVQFSADTLTVSFRDILGHSHDIYEQSKTVSVASDEISRGNIQTAASLEVMSSSSETIVTRIQDANLAVDLMSKSVTETRDKFLEVANSMQSLSTKSAQIESIVELIRDITDQINLLSLNASIEAARAGEYGRGFAVVADEVRKLAAQSAEATRMIRTNMSEIETQIQSSKEKTEITMAKFEEQSKSLEGVLRSTAQMQYSVDEIHSEIIAVSASSGETAASTEEMSATLREMEYNISRYIDRLDELDRVVNDVRAMANVFKLN